jgi:predicted protein tyrosine phosphatase
MQNISNGRRAVRGQVPTFVQVGPGRVALGHRPRKRGLDDLRGGGCTHILTLLGEREGAATIGEAATEAGIEWLWLPLEGGDPPPASRDAEVREVFDRIAALLDQGSAILIHCSAGIHRTGMIAHALLRHLGLSADEARERLRAMRDITASGVGDARLAWGDRFARAVAGP